MHEASLSYACYAGESLHHQKYHILSMGVCWCRQLACPICMKSYADLAAIWRRVDEEVASTPMPEEYACWVAHILCNDCNQV